LSEKKRQFLSDKLENWICITDGTVREIEDKKEKSEENKIFFKRSQEKVTRQKRAKYSSPNVNQNIVVIVIQHSEYIKISQSKGLEQL
jgi:hypothetical protein